MPASRSMPMFPSRWFICRRCQIPSSSEKLETAIGPIAWPRWTTAPGKFWMRSKMRASKVTPLSSLPAITARRGPSRGKATQGLGEVHISQQWKHRCEDHRGIRTELETISALQGGYGGTVCSAKIATRNKDMDLPIRSHIEA